MPSNLFDLSEQYDAMLDQGIRLSGEDKTFFLKARIRDLKHHLPPAFKSRRILDFGCGIGDTAHHLAEAFPEAEIIGVDSASAAIEKAKNRFTSPHLSFHDFASLALEQPFDLCYAHGVFHHIEPAKRSEALDLIYHSLARGGWFALSENNPWNPGTRLVMSKIPFDRDAVPINFLEAKRLIRQAGFSRLGLTRFLFYFPRALAFLRFLEPPLAALPLGAQYYVLAQK